MDFGVGEASEFFFLFSFYSELWRVDCLSFGFSRRLYAFPLDLDLYIRLDIVLTLLVTNGDGETAFISMSLILQVSW